MTPTRRKALSFTALDPDDEIEIWVDKVFFDRLNCNLVVHFRLCLFIYYIDRYL